MPLNTAVFAGLYNTLVNPLMAQLTAMLGAVCTTMQPIALGMVLLWLGFVAFDISNGTKTVQQALRDFFIAGMVIGALQTAQCTQYVSNFFLQAVPNTVTAALGGTGSPVAGLDTVLNGAVQLAYKTYNALPNLSLKSVPLGLGVVAFVVFAAVSIAYAFAIYMTAMIISVVAVVTGPVFLALGAIPMTRRFAAGWFGVLVGGCATQLMALAVIKLLTGTEANMLQQTVIPAASTNNSIDMLWGLVQATILLALCAAVIKKIPDVARAITQGVYHGSAGINAATFGTARQVTHAAAGGAARGARAVKSGATWLAGGSPGDGGGGVPWRTKAPVGRSLSRGDR